jgi:integrase
MSKRGTMVQKAPGKWLLRVYAGRDPETGKRSYPSKMFEGTTAQAKQALTKMLAEHDSEGFTKPSKLNLKEYLKEWLTEKLNITERTRASYQNIIDYIVPELGSVPISKLDSRSVQQFVVKMAGRNFSPRTIRYIYAVLHAAMQHAEKRRLILRNPVEDIELPKKDRKPAKTLTIKQVDLLLEATASSPWQPLWRLLLTTGMRQQEALGLSWKDVDLDGKWLSVTQTLVGDGKGNFEITQATKTDGSVRRISLPESTVTALRAHKTRQNAEILLAGEKYSRNGLVFANAVGLPLDPNKVRRVWVAVLKANGLPTVKLSATRHTHATNLLQDGVNLAWVSARLGHADIKMTRDTYAHVLPEVHAEMGDITERLLRKAKEA